MTIYLVTCFFTFLLGMVVDNNKKQVKNQDINAIFIMIMLLFVWSFVYAFRGRYVGTDTGAYFVKYTMIHDSNMNLFAVINNQRDIGFACIQYFCSKLSNGNWFFFQFVLAILTYFPIIYTIYKNADNISLALLLYIFTMVFFAGFNGTRQAVAVSLISYGYYMFFIKNKWYQFLILSLIAFTFHASVLLVLPFFILSRLRFNSWPIRGSFIFLLLSFFLLWNIWGYILNFFEAVGQSKMATDYSTINSSARGASLLRAIVAFSPIIAGFIKYQTLLKDKRIESELILTIYGGLFTMISVRYWIFNRIALYFSVMTIMFLTNLAQILFAKDKRTGYLVTGLMYFLYMTILLLHGDGHYYPYYFWNNN